MVVKVILSLVFVFFVLAGIEGHKQARSAYHSSEIVVKHYLRLQQHHYGDSACIHLDSIRYNQMMAMLDAYNRDTIYWKWVNDPQFRLNIKLTQNYKP